MKTQLRIWPLLILTLLGSSWAHAEDLAKPARVGILLPTPPKQSAARVKAFLAGMGEHGYIEGRNLVIEVRYAPGGAEQAKYAAELVGLPVDLILTNGTGTTLAAKKATSTIPIVFAIAVDSVAAGLVASLDTPGGNVTGVTDSGIGVSGLPLTALKEAIPRISRVAVIGDTKPKQQVAAKQTLETTAKKLGIDLLFPDLTTAKDIPAAFDAAREWRADAVVAMQQALTTSEQGQIVDLAAKAGLPLLFPRPEGVEAGALISLNDDAIAIFRSSAGYVAKILKGASPATMPVVLVANAELVINLRTAKTLGVTIPPNMLKRATRVIE
jgi:putative tryptophan/tyrosine transport system substrate-binding protein